MDDALSAEELRSFARGFGELSRRAAELLHAGGDDPVGERVLAHLGIAADAVATVAHDVPAVDRPNLQLALDELGGDAGEVLGLSPELRHYAGFSLPALVTGSFRGPTDVVPPVRDDVPIDVDRTLGCVLAGVWLAEFEGEPIAVGIHPLEQHRPGAADVRVSALARTTERASEVLDWLADARHRHNVYRSKVLAFTFSEYGEFGIDFIERPTTRADEVVLPGDDLDSILRHAVGIAEHADRLRAAGQHLKRGLLLFGPPGTGKTHTVGHLMAAMPERTVVVLQGPSVGALGQAAAIVRSLPPAMLVIEDVDLVATERMMHPMGGGNPLLFQLLNEMDGLTPVDDVLFVLTTNRLDLLEPALAARPGRIDHAVEIGLPDAAARRRLFELYLSDVDHDLHRLDDVVERADGVTGAFIKELVRRSVSRSIVAGAEIVDDAHVTQALDEMLDAASPINAAMLGGPQPGLPGSGAMRPPGPMAHGIAPDGMWDEND